jgi:hypothetical protein
MIYYSCRACGNVSQEMRYCCGALMRMVDDPDMDEEEFEYEQ